MIRNKTKQITKNNVKYIRQQKLDYYLAFSMLRRLAHLVIITSCFKFPETAKAGLELRKTI